MANRRGKRAAKPKKVRRVGNAVARPSARSTFSPHERRELLSLGLFPEQIERLELNALRSISWRRVPPPQMTGVREKLADFAKLMSKVERHYLKISTIGTGASAEAVSRLYMAQEALGFDPLKADERDKLHDSLEVATNIVRRALYDLPKVQRRNAWRSAEFVRLILHALRLGHVEHFKCTGYGDTPAAGAMLPFEIKVSRTRKAEKRGNRNLPFGEIAYIVSEATGGWSSDDAIRAYQRQQRIGRLAKKNGK